MSAIVITGNTLTLKSDVTLETVKKLAKYRPSALKLVDDKEKLVFKAGIAAEGTGTVAEMAVYFAPYTNDAAGKAVVTIAIPAGVKDVKDWAADMIAPCYKKLEALEAQMTGAEAEVDTAKAEMVERITQQ